MAFFILGLLVFLALPLAVVAWLIGKALQASHHLQEFRRQLTRLEAEVDLLRKPSPVQNAPPPPLASAPSSEFRVPSSTVPIPNSPPPLLPPGKSPLPRPPSRPASEPPFRAPSFIHWERFIGVQLVAWLGGFALFLATVYFIKLSFENNWISPEIRIVSGYAIGIAILIGGLRLSRKNYAATAQTLCATGVVSLYAVTFAAKSFYGLIGPIPSFSLMALITVGAFFLAVRMDAQVVAVLGLLGGFLTPVLISTGHDNPGGLFGYLAILDAGLIAVALRKKWNHLVLLAAMGTVFMQAGWAGRFFTAAKAWTALGWHMVFFALFFLFPFVRRKSLSSQVMPWAVAALSGPLHFYLVYRCVSRAFPNPFMGLLPAAFAVPPLLGLGFLIRTVPSEEPARNTQSAWFGGAALFFVTLIFPIQFRHEWITLGWALEGAALLWLFHRIPHPGLRLTGVILLLVAFARLTLNGSVLDYHPRSATPILNWYLYTYGIAAACFLIGGRLLAPPRHRIDTINVPPILYGLGAALLFLLLNIEIADYFSTGSALTFQFSGNFARDMTYSIAWAIFAFGLLMIGVLKKIPAARYASLGLLSVTLLKLFFHDLKNLNQLYRIGALVGVAAVLILASLVYQRFLATEMEEDAGDKP